jgi:hypothetical protein
MWLPAAALTGFLASFIFADLLTMPVDLYYLIYFSIISGFFAFYVVKTKLDLLAWFSPRLMIGVVLGVAGGVVMALGVLSRPETETLSGGFLAWALFWRGLVYGSIDGLLLFAFPWIVVWRAFDARNKKLGAKVAAGVSAWVGILIITTAYHLGYADFRSQKIVQPNIGSTIMSLPTLLSANPAASVITHVFLHVTAVIHSPHTELFLPPHYDRARADRHYGSQRSGN